MRTWVHIDDIFPLKRKLYPEGSHAVVVSGLGSGGLRGAILAQGGVRWNVLDIQQFYPECFGGPVKPRYGFLVRITKPEGALPMRGIASVDYKPREATLEMDNTLNPYLEPANQAMLRDHLERMMARHTGITGAEKAKEVASEAARDAISELEREGTLPHGFLRWDIFSHRNEPTRLVFRAVRDFARYPMSAEEYRRVIGRDPECDDLERVNCKMVGQIGHSLCGWDLENNVPRFQYGKPYIAEEGGG